MNTASSLSAERLGALAQHPWTRLGMRHAPSAAALALALILAWQAAGLIWQLFPRAPETDARPAATVIANRPAESSGARSTDVSGIVAAHLFGEAVAEEESTAAVAETDLVDAPETDLPLELRGTLASDNPSEALAIIVDGNEEQVFRIDEPIRRGVTLHAVQPLQVILNRNGKLEALSLPEKTEGATQTAAAVRRPTRVSSQQRTERTVSDVIQTNAPQLQQIISPRPYYVGGQQRGYRLYPARDRRKFAALGLRPGDVVTEINGMPLTNPAQGAQIFAQLATAQAVTVTLERNGSPQTLTLDVNQISAATQANEQ